MNPVITLGQFYALVDWNEKKTYINFLSMYKLWFNSGNPLYRICKIVYNTISGKYKERETFYVCHYDTMVKN